MHALAEIKRAAAEVNRDLGLLDAAKAAAIADGRGARGGRRVRRASFPLSVWQTGSGTQSNMNVNEVVASLASRALGGGLGAARRVHPNDDVNLGQSSNDVFPTRDARRRGAGRCGRCWRRWRGLRGALQAKARGVRRRRQDRPHPPAGRHAGHAWARSSAATTRSWRIAEAALRQALPAVHALAIGGTAVGTGLNTHPEFGRRVAARAGRAARRALRRRADNLFAAMAGHEALVGLHGALRMLAVALNKIANDIRLMGSGPRAGLGELRLPDNEPGSSIMPGKVNPTQVEALTMVCAQVMGHDVAIGIAASQGQFELNVYKPLIAHDVLDSLRLLADAMASFAAHCVEGIEVDARAHARSC